MSKPNMGAMFGGQSMAGLFDIPFATQGEVSGADIVVMGAPIATSYETVGAYCVDAPNTIRAGFGWPGVGEHFDFDLDGKLLGESAKAVDWGDLECSSSDFEFNRGLIKENVKTVLDAGAAPVVLGGDDSIPIPVLQAYENHGPVTILQLDAHIDWRDEVQGEKMGLSSNMRRASEMGWVENIIQVGARGAGSARPSDVADGRRWGVKFFPMKQIRCDDIRTSINSIVDAIPRDSGVYIALDIDVMDPSVVPGVIGPAPGGFSYYEVLSLLESVADRARLTGFNLAEFMPSTDIGNHGALMCARLTASVVGLIARQRGLS
jgi:agmatinase